MADSGSPLNMGVPWESLSQLPGNDNAAYGLHLRQAIAPQVGAQQGPSPERIPGQEELSAALGNMRDFQARLSATMAAQAVPQPAEAISMKTSPDGQKIVKVETTQENYQATLDSAMKYHQMLGGYAQQLDQMQARMKAQEENLRAQPPWVQLATALSANLAQAKDMPGWVQGLGATAAQLNPNPDQIEMKRAGLLREQAGIAEKGAALDVAALRTQLAAQEKQNLITQKQSEELARIEGTASVAARTYGEFEPVSYIAEMTARGQDPKIAQAAADRLSGVAKIAQSRIAAVRDAADAKEAAKAQQFYDALAANADNINKQIASREKLADASAARGEQKMTAAEAEKKAKLAEPGPVLKKQLADLNAADTALDKIEAELMNPANQAIMGPAAGRLASGAAKIGVDPGGKIAELKQRLGLQTAQAIKATGAGARGFGPQERPYFEQLAEGITRTPAQNLRIVQGWRDFLDQERRGIQVTNPDVAANEKYAAVWGKRLGGPPAAAAPSADVWTPEKVKALREAANGGR
jgi:hypothetical protein